MLCLNPSATLQPATDCVEMRNSSDIRTPVFHLHPITAVLLALCDGTRSEAEIVRQTSAIFGLAERSVLETPASAKSRFRMFLTDGITRPAVDLEPLIFPSQYDMNRYEAPITLTWVVTGHCDKGCIYCYQAAQRSTSAPDATLTFERVAELIDEAVALGIHTIKLSGGEPFLRPDLHEIIELMISKGIDVRILTKTTFTPEGAQRLARTGLKSITISLDSIDETASDSLVMVKGYTRQAMESIRNLMKAGIRVSVNAVVCSSNFPLLEPSIHTWRDMGVHRITVSEFWESAGRTPHHLKLSRDQLNHLVELVSRYQEDPVCPLDFATECDSLVGMHNCSHGLNTMAVLPDGRVSRCEHLPVSVPEIIVGDLKTESILDVWNASRFVHLVFPEEHLFEGTACHGCGEFKSCNSNGRCLMVPLIHQDRLFGPSCNQVFVQLDEEVK